MKQIQLFAIIILISTFMKPQLSAQGDLLGSTVYNRVLLVNYVDDVANEAKNELTKLFKKMRSRVPGCEWSHVGDLMKSTKGYEQIITLTFTSESSLEKYNSHPDYKRFLELSSVILEDFEIYETVENMDF